MFRKNDQPMTAEDHRRIAEKHKAALKSELKIFLTTGLVTVAAAIAVVAGSIAWFANNKEIRANDSMISTGTPSASLFIANGNSIDGNYYNAVSLGASEGLYPISTVDCKDWYYASDWKSVLANPGSPTDKTTKVVACGYTKVDSVVFADAGGAAKYTADSRDYYAYYKHTVNVYTDRESLDVYLNPDDPIRVSYFSDDYTAEQRAAANKIASALRIAVTYTDNIDQEHLLVYYIPESESGTGNSAGAKTDTYQGINGTAETNIIDISEYYTQSTIGSITAEPMPDVAREYQKKSDSLLLGKADSETGLVLNTYVWLEGTDAQTLKDITAGISDGLQVVLSVVGVEPD